MKIHMLICLFISMQVGRGKEWNNQDFKEKGGHEKARVNLLYIYM